MFEYLVVSDFDGTLARTFDPSPSGIDVNEAYAYAVKSIFGKAGLEIYAMLGGLKNRAPSELITELLQNEHQGQLVERARNFFQKKKKLLNIVIPPGKGAPLEWKSDELWDPRGTITEILVRCKLSRLMTEIGTMTSCGSKWPEPCKGVMEFVNFLRELKNDKYNIRLAILSSGHEEFIRRTFAVWGLNYPTVTVTDDDLRGREYPDSHQRVKPSATLFDLLHLAWAESNHKAIEPLRLLNFVRETRPRMMYIGDDHSKDGKLAEASGVPFGWFCENRSSVLSLQTPSFLFSDWKNLISFFRCTATQKALEEGTSFTKIFEQVTFL